MKSAIGLIAATLVSASVYSQDYTGSSSTNPDSTPDYRSRQSESGAPVTSDSGNNSSAGYDRAPGLSGGNSSTGQSSGANVGNAADQDQSLTTRDSDLNGSEYRGSAQSKETSSESSSSISDPGSSSDEGVIKGSGNADGAFHLPAEPVREGSTSEGWSGAGTFSGAGPGSVSGSASSSDSKSSSGDSSIPAPTESSNGFSTDVSGNAGLTTRDDDLRDRGLEPDGNQLSHDETLMDRVDRDFDDADTVIMEDWTAREPDSNVGGPAESEFGTSNSSEPGISDSYSNDLYQRVQRGWSNRPNSSGADVRPTTPSVMDHEFDHLRIYNGTSQSDAGGFSGNQQGQSDSNKAVNDSSGDESASKNSAPGEYGDRPTKENYDDGHLSGDSRSPDDSKKTTEPYNNPPE